MKARLIAFIKTHKKALVIVFGILLVIHLLSFHYIRGTRIEAPTATSFEAALNRLSEDGTLISSQVDMDDLGAVAWQIVERSGRSPGVFYVHYIDELDWIEKFHHLAHQPFTGLKTCYTDIWVNSLTCYGKKEASWGFSSIESLTADKFAILILLIDRLSREMSNFSEHISCYVEVLQGMKVHTLKGRAAIYQMICQLAKENENFKTWLLKMLNERNPLYISSSERQMWGLLRMNPSYGQLEKIASGQAKALAAQPGFKEGLLMEKVIGSMP